MIGKPATPEAYKLLHDGSLALADVERAGMRVDVDYLNRSTKKVLKKVKELEEEVKQDPLYEKWKRLYGEKTKLGSRPQLSNLLVKEGILEEVRDKRTDNIKGDETALEKTNHSFPMKIIKIEKLKKAEATYLRGLLREACDGFIHPSCNLNIPITYRSSMEMPNSQNLPNRIKMFAKLVRSAFIPRDGHNLLELDFKGAEVCIAACYNKDPRLIEYIKDKSKDMHKDMGAEIFMCGVADVTKDMRFHSKNNFVFAEFYGSVYENCAPTLWESINRHDLTMEDGTLVLDHLKKQGIKKLGDCSFGEKPKKGTFEQHLMEVEDSFWNDRFKVYSKWKEERWQDYLEKGWADYKTGFIVRGLYSRNEVINYPIQGASFHCLLWCLIKMVKFLKKHKMKTKLITQVHDSMLLDVHKKEVDAIIEYSEKLMEQIRKHWTWIIVPLEIEYEMSETTWYDKKELIR